VLSDNEIGLGFDASSVSRREMPTVPPGPIAQLEIIAVAADPKRTPVNPFAE